MPADYSELWYWVVEREVIRLKKERGDLMPWTEDPILHKYRFCCVRREDDSVTRWVRSNIRDRFAGSPDLWFMLCAARQINWPPTLRRLIEEHKCWPGVAGFSPEAMAECLESDARQGLKVFTGVYRIPSEPGKSKATHVAVTTLGNLWKDRPKLRAHFNRPFERLQDAHSALVSYSWWGDFLAYQAVVDMRFTHLLGGAVDVLTWAAAGPGTVHGLNRVHGRPVDKHVSQAQALDEMLEIYTRVERETGVGMDLSDVPNILCETDKYLRVKNGEGEPRTLYVPGRGC